MRNFAARALGLSVIAGAALISPSATGPADAAPLFTPKPCQSALYQSTSVFADGQAIVNDCRVRITSAADVAARRAQLIRFIWGDTGFPAAKLPVSIDKNVVSPLAGLPNLERVDTLHIAMRAGQVGIAYHFIPLLRKANRLVVLQNGHVCTFDDDGGPTDSEYGMRRTIASLLSDGYSVLAVYMPHMDFLTPGNCGRPSHDTMFRTLHPPGSPLQFFLEPIAVSLNYLQARAVADHFPPYQDFSMVGLSGGGWTTDVYAAIDPRIRLSIPVAGSIPLYLRFPTTEGDTEQNLSAFYRIAGYPDLHVMGSFGNGRRQVQVLNRRDECCFGEMAHSVTLSGMTYDRAMRSDEWRIRGAMSVLPRGSYRLEIDEAATGHMISWSNVSNVILAELNQDRHTAGAASKADVFVRGSNGNLWHAGPSGWEDTRLPMVGAPAAVGGGSAPFNVFYRDTGNRLTRAFIGTGGWTSTTIGGAIINDPVAASTAPGRFDVVALGTDYTPSHWWSNGTGFSVEHLSAQRGLGQPTLIAAPGRLDVFMTGFDRAVHHIRKTGAGVVNQLLGGIVSDAPSAVATTGTAGTTRRVFVHGQDNRIWAASSLNDGSWQWAQLPPLGIGDRFTGSPSAAAVGSTVYVQVRTTGGTMGRLRFTSTGWTYTNVGGAIVDSPTSVGNAAYAHGWDGTLLYFDGTKWLSKGGRFD